MQTSNKNILTTIIKILVLITLVSIILKINPLNTPFANLFNLKQTQKHQYQSTIDSLNTVNESLYLNIQSNIILLDSLKRNDTLLTQKINDKQKEIDKLKNKKNEDIDIINNGSAIDSYNRLSERYNNYSR